MNVSITKADGGFIIEVDGELFVVNTLSKVVKLVKETFGEEKEGE
mgnify:CR=1 FL=1|jgi:hypothetical protein